jgi:tripartite-type tricarboxylate transporter receptor subunit TctC
MKNIMNAALFLTAAMIAAPSIALADDFYAGKSISIIVGYRAGGGYDTYTRLVARHMGKHIPGNPSVVVENKGGAGSKLAANYLYSRSQPDGLTAGVFGGGLLTQQALESKGVSYDGRKFKWVGSMAEGNPACVIMGFTGLKTLDDVLKSKKILKMGSTGAGSTTDDLPRLLKGLLGAKLDVVAGFKGTSAVRVSMQRKELDGACWTWDSIRVTARSMLDAKGDQKLIPYLIEGKFEDPELNGVPQLSEVVQGDENRAAIRAWLAPYKMLRPIALPPGTPQDKVEILRAAFLKTMADPTFLKEIKKLNLDLSFKSGAEVDKLAEESLTLTPAVKKKLISMIGRPGK